MFSLLRCINIWSISVRNSKSWWRPYRHTSKSHGQPRRIQHVASAATASKFQLWIVLFFLPTFMLLIHTSTRDNDHNHDVRNENEPSSISSMWLGLERSKSSRKKVRKWRQTRDEREIITEIYFFWPKSWFWTLSKVGWPMLVENG